MAPKKPAKAGSKSGVATPKKRVAANGFKLPEPIPAGQVITDIGKKEWVLGRSIGQGGFGEIYLASDDPSRPVCDTDKYVVKVEPHSNGPLFAEMHCYMRIAKPALVEEWMKEKKLKRFGMPKFLGSGSFVYDDQKYRFMVIERFGSDLQKIIEQHNKKFSFKTVYQIGLEIIDVLEYIHSKGYIHADIKASNLLVGFQKQYENQACSFPHKRKIPRATDLKCDTDIPVFLVDYGLACRYVDSAGVHKEYRYDGRKAHDGTIEFTSRDAHIGAHSRRGDLEILGYNLLQWLCGRLPWEDNLSDCDYVAKHKRWYMEKQNQYKLFETCFPDDAPIPPGLPEFFSYVAGLTFDEKPDYDKCRQILRDGLVERGYKDDGKLVFMSATPKASSKKAKSRLKVSSASSMEDIVESSSSGASITPGRKNVKTAAAKKGKSPLKGVVKKRVNVVQKTASAKARRVSKDMFDSSIEEDLAIEYVPKATKRGAPKDRNVGVQSPAAKVPKTLVRKRQLEELSSEEKENSSDSANGVEDFKLQSKTTPVRKRVVQKKAVVAKSPLGVKSAGVSKAKAKKASPAKAGFVPTPAMLERMAIIKAKNEAKGRKK